MRRVCAVLLIMPILLLCACANGSVTTPSQIQSDINCSVRVEYGGITIIATLMNMKEGVTSINISSPDTLKGLTYRWKDSKLSILYNGIECNTEDGYLPQSGFSQALYNVLKTVGSDEKCIYKETKDDIATFSGSSSSGNYTLKTESASGRIKELIMSDIDMKVTFFNYEKS